MTAQSAAQSFVNQRRQAHPSSLRYYLIPQGTHLDIGRWGFEANAIRSLILEWLEQRTLENR